MSDIWTPKEILSNPQSEALIEELKHWTIVQDELDEDIRIKLSKI